MTFPRCDFELFVHPIDIGTIEKNNNTIQMTWEQIESSLSAIAIKINSPGNENTNVASRLPDIVEYLNSYRPLCIQTEKIYLDKECPNNFGSCKIFIKKSPGAEWPNIVARILEFMGYFLGANVKLSGVKQ